MSARILLAKKQIRRARKFKFLRLVKISDNVTAAEVSAINTELKKIMQRKEKIPNWFAFESQRRSW